MTAEDQAAKLTRLAQMPHEQLVTDYLRLEFEANALIAEGNHLRSRIPNTPADDGDLVSRLRTATDIGHEDLVAAADEIERLRNQLAQCRAEYTACIATVDRLENGSAADELERMVDRERQAAIILATALAVGGYSQMHADWLHEATVWLNDRRAADVPAEPKQCPCDKPFEETCMSRHFTAGIRRCQLTGELTTGSGSADTRSVTTTEKR